MKKLTECLKLEFLLFRRSYLNYILFFLFQIIAVFIFSKSSQFNIYSPADLLIKNSISIQFGIFIFLIIGFNLARREYIQLCDEIFQSIKSSNIYKITAKLSIILFMSIAYYLSSIGILFLIYSKLETFSELYFTSIEYFTLYYFLPFTICGVLGLLVGSFFKSRFIYPILLFLGILLGTFNEAIFNKMMIITQTDLWSYRNFFNLGISDHSLVYDPIYGYSLEMYRWIKNSFILVSLVITLYYSIFFKNNIKIKKQLVFLITIFGLLVESTLGFMMIEKRQVIYTQGEKNSVWLYDQALVSGKSSLSPKKIQGIKVISYNIKLDIKTHINAKVDVKFNCTEDLNQVRFTLYKDLNIKEVRIGSKKIDYKQNGNHVDIFFSGSLTPTKEYTISFDYSGFSSPIFFANEQAINLPAHFPWLPISGDHEIFVINGSTNPLNPIDKIHYKLNFNTDRTIFTNLKKVENSKTWEGDIKGGVTLVSSRGMNVKDISNVHVYVPASIDKADNSIKVLIDNIKSSIFKINTKMKLNIKMPDKIFILSQIGVGAISRDNLINYQDDQLILVLCQEFNNVHFATNIVNTDIEASVLRSISNNINTYDIIEIIDIFLYGYNYYFNKESENTMFYDLDKKITECESNLSLTSKIDKNFYKEVNHLKSQIEFYKEYKKLLDLKKIDEDNEFIENFYTRIINKDFTKTEEMINYIRGEIK